MKLESNCKVKKGDKIYLSFIEPGKAGVRKNEHLLGIALEDAGNYECKACEEFLLKPKENHVEIFVK